MKIKYFSKIVFTLVLVFSFMPIRFAHAGYWGEEWAAMIWKDYAEKIYAQIEGMMLGTLKNAAIQVMNAQIRIAIGGGAQGGPMFIVNYDQFLFAQPQQAAQVYINDFFTMTTGGRGSSSYRSLAQVDVTNNVADAKKGKRLWLAQEGVVAGSSVAGVWQEGGGNYYNYLVDSAKRSIFQGVPRVGDCMANVSSGFSSWRDVNCFAASNPINNPMGYALMAQNAYAQERQRQEQMNFTMAVAGQGYLPQTKNGSITTPGITIKSVMDTTLKGFDAITSASNWQELAGGAVSGAFNTFVQEVTQQGINMAQNYVQGQVNAQLGKVGVSARIGGYASIPPSVSSGYSGGSQVSRPLCSGSDCVGAVSGQSSGTTKSSSSVNSGTSKSNSSDKAASVQDIF